MALRNLARRSGRCHGDSLERRSAVANRHGECHGHLCPLQCDHRLDVWWNGLHPFRVSFAPFQGQEKVS